MTLRLQVGPYARQEHITRKKPAASAVSGPGGGRGDESAGLGPDRCLLILLDFHTADVC